MAEKSRPCAEMVHQQLECIKYVGWPKRVLKGDRYHQEPSGQGVPIDLVAMPDLLLDFRHYRLNVDTNDRPGRYQDVCLTGGRAARVAGVLQHLAADEEGTFRVYLATRTAELGKQLLSIAFKDSPSQKTFLSECLQGVLVRPGEPRTALRMKADAKALSQDALSEEELAPSDLSRYPLAELIARARTLYFASLTYKVYHDLLDALIAQARGTDSPATQRALFLDASHADRGPSLDADYVLDRLPDWSANAGPDAPTLAFGGVFVRESAVKYLLELSAARLTDRARPTDLAGLAAYVGVPLIQFGADSEVHCAHPRLGVLSVRCRAKFDAEGVPERFKAGVLLASTVRRTVADVARLNEGLAAGLDTQWGDGPDGKLSWQRILGYGVELAELAEGETGPRMLSALLTPAARTGAAHHNRVRLTTDQAAPGSGSRHLRIDRDSPGRLAALAELRRAGLTLAPQADRKEVRFGLMFDLDGTLLDSTEQRGRSLRVALQALGEALTSASSDAPPLPAAGDSPEAWVRFFEEHVYNPHRLYQALGLGDFRQEWNHDGWYAALIALGRPPADEALRDELRRFASLTGRQQDEALRDWQLDPSAGRAVADEAELPTTLRRLYHDALQEHREPILQAQAAFRATALSPYKEARDCLRSLQLDDRFELYVVSEGHPNVQWMKLRSTGLDRFFDPKRVLTTGDASQPVRERRRLKDEMDHLEAAGRRVSEERERLTAVVRELLDRLKLPLDKLARSTERRMLGRHCLHTDCPYRQHPGEAAEIVCATYRARIVELEDCEARHDRLTRRLAAARFVSRVLDRMSEKGMRTFYAAAIRAILRNPKTPLDSLRAFQELLVPLSERPTIRLAMIGDRQDNDIDPPLELLGSHHLMTIRLRAGRYADREASVQNEPSYLADTLAQVKALLLAANHGEETAEAVDPPIYRCAVRHGLPEPTQPGYEDVEFALLADGIELRAVAMKDEELYSFIPQICAGVLGEYVTTRVPPWWLAYCHPESRLVSADADRRRRVQVLSVLTNEGFYGPGAGTDQAAAVLECLRRDARLLRRKYRDEEREPGRGETRARPCVFGDDEREDERWKAELAAALARLEGPAAATADEARETADAR